MTLLALSTKTAGIQCRELSCIREAGLDEHEDPEDEEKAVEETEALQSKSSHSEAMGEAQETFNRPLG